MPFTLHHDCILETGPRAVMRDPEKPKDETAMIDRYLTGKFYRVFPKTGDDVQFLRNLEHRRDKFAPASGHGVLIIERLMEGWLATRKR